jgi:signal transduction histidine kinase/ligand-binding sensor domain-containing protein
MLALLFALIPLLHAQPDSTAPTMRNTWRAQDGLPENTVQSIQQTPSGHLWVGTTGGAVSFDGAHFLPIPTAEGSIFSMLAARDGTLWFGTEGAGLIRIRNGVTTSIFTSQGLTDGFVRAVLEDHTGRIWIGTDDGLFWIEGNTAHQLDTAQFGQPLSVHALMEDASGRLWIGGSKVIVLNLPTVLQRQAVWQEYTLPGAYSENRVKSILQTRDGDVWVGTVGGLDRLDPRTSNSFTRVPGVVGTVRTLLQTTDGRLWVGTIGHGLYVSRGTAFQRFAATGMGTINTVLSLFEDDSQQLWVGSQDGLMRLRRDPVRIVPLPNDRPPDFATLSRDRGDALWAVSSRTYHIDHGIAQPAHFPGLEGVTIRMIFRDRAGSLWLGTDGSGVYHQTPTGLEHFLAPARLVNNFIRAFLESDSGDIWVATDEGVSRIHGKLIDNLRMADGLAYFSTRSLLQAHDGTIWIGTERGISCWKNGHFLSNAVTNALAREKVWSMLQTSDGALWFGTRDHGLYRYTSAGLDHFRVPQGLASDSIYQLLEGADHRVWLSGPAGISSFLPNAINSSQLAVTVYDLPTGDTGTQMYGGRQPAGAVDASGMAWFASDRGAVGILPEEPSQRVPPRATITAIRVDGRPLDPALSSLDLSQAQSQLEIAFAPVLLRPQAGVRIRYRLAGSNVDGSNDAWTDAGAARSVSYTRLPAGTYKFEVAVFEADRPDRISLATLPLHVRPHFYRTWWFLSLCLIGLVILAVAIYRIRLRQVRLRFQAVLGERSRLAREMHDTVIQGCTGVSALLEALASLGEENRPLREEIVEHARVQVRTTIDEARQAVWNLRSRDRLCIDLPEKIEQLAAQVRSDYATAVVARFEGTNRPIGDFAARELLMVVREAVYNAALHAAPTQIDIVLHSLPDAITIEVTDNGIGFSPDEPSQTLHYGIAGMRERVERLKGDFQLRSQPGQGTVLTARLRRNALLPHSPRATEL